MASSPEIVTKCHPPRGVEENGTIPSEPKEEMYAILGCHNGAQVNQYLRQAIPGFNVRFEPGFCTALNKEILVCLDDTRTPKNFTAFFTPPMKDNIDEDTDSNLLKLAVHERYNNEELHLLTKMEAFIPMSAQDLRHHVRNITGVTGRILGEDSLIYESLKVSQDHITDHEMVCTQ